MDYEAMYKELAGKYTSLSDKYVELSEKHSDFVINEYEVRKLALISLEYEVRNA
jgi:hypothetical protein